MDQISAFHREQPDAAKYMADIVNSRHFRTAITYAIASLPKDHIDGARALVTILERMPELKEKKNLAGKQLKPVS